jgi:hypothetical protein
MAGSPDPSINYNVAREKRQKNTGQWLLDSPAYRDWKTRPSSRLWLHGKPGCGKTIMSSTVVKDVQTIYQHTPRAAVLFFYFRHDFKPTKEYDD